MNIGMITYADVGNWYIGEEGIPLQLIKCYGMLLYCQAPTERVYYPAYDIIRQISEAEAERLKKETAGKKIDYRICKEKRLS